jgi:predicted alpha/beta superfamily hydrolase
MKKIIAMLFVFCFNGQLQASTNKEETVKHVSHNIQSSILEESRDIRIVLPESYTDKSETNYPVVYVLDGHLDKPVTSVQEFLSEKGHIPEMIKVFIPHTGKRNRDYRSVFKESDKINPGADKFLAFLETELIPMIESTYRTTDYRILIGHSTAGTFVIHTLIKKPALFKARFAFSPASHHIPYQRKMLKEFFKAKPSLAGFFYANVGGTEWFKIKDAFKELQDIFDTYSPKGLRFQFDLHELDGHQSSPLIGSHIAFKKLYAPLRLGDDYEGMSYGQVVDHFENISTEYGFTVIPQLKELKSMQGFFVTKVPDQRTLTVINQLLEKYYPNAQGVAGNSQFYTQWLAFGTSKEMQFDKRDIPDVDMLLNMGYRHFLKQDYETAKFIFKLAVKLYPQQANPLDSLGEATELSGDLKTAYSLYSQAYELAKKNKDPELHVKAYQQHMKSAKTAINKNN